LREQAFLSLLSFPTQANAHLHHVASNQTLRRYKWLAAIISGRLSGKYPLSAAVSKRTLFIRHVLAVTRFELVQNGQATRPF
jgi:hypothetical protein